MVRLLPGDLSKYTPKFQFYTVNHIPALANSVDTDEKQLIRKELNKIVFWNYLLLNKLFCSKNKKNSP